MHNTFQQHSKQLWKPVSRKIRVAEMQDIECQSTFQNIFCYQMSPWPSYRTIRLKYQLSHVFMAYVLHDKNLVSPNHNSCPDIDTQTKIKVSSKYYTYNPNAVTEFVSIHAYDHMSKKLMLLRVVLQKIFNFNSTVANCGAKCPEIFELLKFMKISV